MRVHPVLGGPGALAVTGKVPAVRRRAPMVACYSL
jgi:hypothetical protein